jgi:acetyl-CoA carboxylase biotin carboxyl carrier protein
MADRKKRAAEGFQVEAGRTSLDVDALRQIVEILEASEVSRLIWANGDEKLVIRRGPLTTTQVVQQIAGPAASHPAPAVHLVPTAAPAAAPESPRARPSAPVRAPSAAAEGEKKGQLINSPFVGTFYRTPAPDQPPYVDVGAVVKKGQVLCIVEAMKLMNEIESDVAGKVVEILVENAQPVEFGQPLFRIEPV